MKREDDLEEEVEKEEGPGMCPGTGDAKKPEGGGASDEREGVDMVLVAMTNTTISVVRGRGCDSGSPCHDCGGTGCTFNDVVVVAGSSKVTLGKAAFFSTVKLKGSGSGGQVSGDRCDGC